MAEPTILLRSGRKASTPGVTRLVREAVPQSKVVLWSAGMDTNRADFFLHGSGPLDSVPPRIPYGIFGLTLPAPDTRWKALLDGAFFVYTRETKSLANLKAAGVATKRMAFVPDGVFATEPADSSTPGGYLAVVPRLRGDTVQAELDAAKFREVIIEYVRQTGNKVALVMDEPYPLDTLLKDPLPSDVGANVVHAKPLATTYRQAAIVLSSTSEAAMLAASQGTPLIYVHHPDASFEMQMWSDLGLASCVRNADEAPAEEMIELVMGIVARPGAARQKVKDAVAAATKLQTAAMKVLVEAF